MQMFFLNDRIEIEGKQEKKFLLRFDLKAAAVFTV